MFACDVVLDIVLHEACIKQAELMKMVVETAHRILDGDVQVPEGVLCDGFFVQRTNGAAGIELCNSLPRNGLGCVGEIGWEAGTRFWNWLLATAA